MLGLKGAIIARFTAPLTDIQVVMQSTNREILSVDALNSQICRYWPLEIQYHLEVSTSLELQVSIFSLQKNV